MLHVKQRAQDMRCAYRMDEQAIDQIQPEGGGVNMLTSD